MVPKSCFHVAYVCIVYTDVSNVHYQTIYCEKSTVEETGHFTWTRITSRGAPELISGRLVSAGTRIFEGSGSGRDQ